MLSLSLSLPNIAIRNRGGGYSAEARAAGNTVERYMMAGVDYPWEVTQVNNSGTDADMGIYALYSQ